MEEGTKRIKIMNVTGSMILSFFQVGEKHFMVEAGLPLDARIMNARMSPNAGNAGGILQLVIASESYPEMAARSAIKEVDTIKAVHMEKVVPEEMGAVSHEK